MSYRSLSVHFRPISQLQGTFRTMAVGKVSRRPWYDLSPADSVPAIWFEYRFVFSGGIDFKYIFD